MSGKRKTVSDAESRFDELIEGLKDRLGLRDPVRIVPYRGYASGDVLYLQGRALEAEAREDGVQEIEQDDSLWDDLLRWFHRVESDEIPHARLAARWGDHDEELEASEEGYFQWRLDGGPERGDELRWETVDLEMRQPVYEGAPATAGGPVVVPARDAAFAVVSDLDDTVIRTGADNSLRMARTIFFNNARSRTAFPGVGCFYRALQADRNPLFYVSSSPWNYYELFDQFLDFQDIPLGPIFLKDFGVQEEYLVKPDHGDHKTTHVRRLMEEFPDLPFVLLGDSGQKDAEIYCELAKEVGDRIEVVYIRDVSGDGRDEEVDRLAAEAGEHGVEMVRVESTVEAARHAVGWGLVDEGVVEEVEAEREEEMGREDGDGDGEGDGEGGGWFERWF